MKVRFAFVSFLFLFTAISGLLAQDTIVVHPDLQLIKMSPHTYRHVSYSVVEPWGRIPSNGLLVVDKGEAMMMDTPMEDSITSLLLTHLTEEMGLRIVAFVPNHWHNDCTAGMDLLSAAGIATYALDTTNKILADSGLPVADFSFAERLHLKAGSVDVIIRYYGAGHAVDNVVAFVPGDRVLFAGCMSKSAWSKGLGYTGDADMAAWPRTIARVRMAHPGVKIVVPGHGSHSGVEALENTLRLLGEED